jgi:hypothetical protein
MSELSRVFWSAYKDHHPDGAILDLDLMPEEDQAAMEAGAQAVADHVTRPRAGAPLRDRQGVQFGDGNTQVNSFGSSR